MFNRNQLSKVTYAGLAIGVLAGLAVSGGAASAATASESSASIPATVASSALSAAPLHTGAAASSAATVSSYWTRSRMLSARDADVLTAKAPAKGLATNAVVPRGKAGHVSGAAPTQALAGATRNVAMSGPVGTGWTGSFYSPPATTTGKVFFSTYTKATGTKNWVCSGSAVNSKGKDVVFTAGHCVYGSLGGEVPGEGWHSNFEFVPDYYYGYAPYGTWTAKQLWTLTNYLNTGGAMTDEGDDIGAAVINTNSSGQHIVNVVGGQGLAWNWPSSEAVYDFGYPAASPFNGQSLQYCNGSEFSWSVSNTMGLACNFTGGSSGGPWLAFFGGEFGDVNGVNAFGYSSIPGYIFSPYFGNNADSLYNSVANL